MLSCFNYIPSSLVFKLLLNLWFPEKNAHNVICSESLGKLYSRWSLNLGESSGVATILLRIILTKAWRCSVKHWLTAQKVTEEQTIRNLISHFCNVKRNFFVSWNLMLPRQFSSKMSLLEEFHVHWKISIEKANKKFDAFK